MPESRFPAGFSIAGFFEGANIFIKDISARLHVAWSAFRDYFASGKLRGGRRVADIEGLRHFIDSRSSHVAQTSLYGYIRTRAGTRYPELFENQLFIDSINIAKWQIWAACLSDLAIYAGGLLHRSGAVPTHTVRDLMETAVERILDRIGVPDEAGPDFSSTLERLRRRIRHCDWSAVEDGEDIFTESPEALVHWTPIVDELKQLDDEIVRNSIRFRWVEVRDDLRANLRAEELAASLAGAGPDRRAPVAGTTPP
jgi:hypothetical protein